ncbi:MAG: phosphoenolpyruvate synthase [Alistipes sp.]|nr:phosphoenolpyruvate synthase [Alistipes sp.]
MDTQQNEKGKDYSGLMSRRIRRILLVCNSYDSYTLEEDGRLEVQITQEYSELNLSNPPSITRVESTIEALELISRSENFDLVITMYNVGQMDVYTFSHKMKQICPTTPVVLLTNFSKEIYRQIESNDTSSLDYVFCWNNSTDLIIAIIKLIEDSMNAEHDCIEFGVQTILLVEDSVRYYSTYLPAIYKLVLQQNGASIRDALNEQQQIARKRARPKILMATNYDDAVALYERYKGNMLGVISDVGFVIHKGDDPATEKLDAGIDLCNLIHKDNPTMPFLMQSSQESMREVADSLGVGFVVKHSKTLIHEISEYIGRAFAFGDFVLTDPDTGEQIARAEDLLGLERLLHNISDTVLSSVVTTTYLSKWLLSRGIFSLGNSFRELTLKEFNNDIAAVRQFLTESLRDYRIKQGLGVVARFTPDTYNDAIWFARLGNGSIGGKARGLAFMNHILQQYNLYNEWQDVRVMIPRTLVVTTEYFDRFIIENGLQYVINADLTDAEILSEFVASSLPTELTESLRVFIRGVKKPLAVRSSSKLEDSYYQPFAGIYSTYMIPHTENEDQKLRLLSKAIKSVYASVYFASSRAYITATANVISEEKMAIVLQEICGSEDRGYFFPTLSGVARSLNFYPIGYERAEEGVAKVAFGLGKAVVDGEQVLRFSPKYPQHILQTSTPELTMRETQQTMYALNLQPDKFKTSIDDAVNLERLKIADCAQFRNIKHVTSTWDMQRMTLTDSPFAEGVKVVTFSKILKYNSFPLADILCRLLEIGQNEMKTCVEIEFAANLDRGNRFSIFNVLQIRPIAAAAAETNKDWSTVEPERALIYSQSALGTGYIEGVSDVIYLRRENFDPAATQIIAEQTCHLNSQMRAQGRGYLLVGFGRWGSSDPWLGVPVRWSDISEVKVIVECGLDKFRIEPSQGTHFFQNMTSFGVGYMTVNPHAGDGVLNFDALDAMPALYESEYIRHVRFEHPLEICIDGVKNKGVVEIGH